MTSIQAGPLEMVVTILEREGYQRLQKPLSIAGTEFDFEAAVRGTERSHDLVLVSTYHVSALRLRRLLAGLARSLDLAQSRRPITLIVVGEFTSADKEDLERHARVLHIDAPAPSEAQVERAIAVLLPLELPKAAIMHGQDPLNEVVAALGARSTTAEHIALIRAAAGGASEVRLALQSYVNAGIAPDTQIGAQNG